VDAALNARRAKGAAAGCAAVLVVAPVPGQGRLAIASGAPVHALDPVCVHGPVRASCFHAWFASSPAATARLIQSAPPGFAHG
jgi:cobyrinic acid a,c-diamide synthase